MNPQGDDNNLIDCGTCCLQIRIYHKLNCDVGVDGLYACTGTSSGFLSRTNPTDSSIPTN